MSKLLDKDTAHILPTLYATEDIPLEEKTVLIKYFSPYSNWTWYVIEGEQQENGRLLILRTGGRLREGVGIFLPAGTGITN